MQGVRDAATLCISLHYCIIIYVFYYSDELKVDSNDSPGYIRYWCLFVGE